MAQYRIKLGVQLDTKGLKGQINGIQTKPIKLKVDDSEYKRHLNTIKSQLAGMNFSNPSIKRITKDLNEASIAAKKVSTHLKKNGNVAITVKGIDKLKRAVTITKEFDKEGKKIGNTVIKVDADVSKVKKLTRELKTLKKDASKSTQIKLDAKKTEQELKRIQSLAKQIGKTRFKIGTLDASANAKQIELLKKELRSLMTQYNQTASSLSKKGITGFGTHLSNELVKSKRKLQEFDAKLADTKAKAAKSAQIKIDAKKAEQELKKIQSLAKKSSDIKFKLDTGKFSNDISNVTTKFNNLSKKSHETKVAIQQLKNALNQIKSASIAGDANKIVASYDRYNKILKKVENQLKINQRLEKQQAAAQKGALANQKLDDDKALFRSNIDSWLKNNSAAAKKFGAQMNMLKAQVESCDRAGLNHLIKEFKLLDKQASMAGKKTQTFGDKLKTQFSKYTSYLSVASAFMYASMALKDMFQQVVAIDSAMTELKKVTNETDAAYSQFLTNASSRASEIGTTVDGLVKSTADFARLGFEFTEAQGLAEVANIYAVVGDEIDSVETATQSLISTLTAFKDEAGDLSDSEFALEIVDKMNEVSNNFAISSGGIGEALARSASSMQAANNSLDETIALITAANTVVQDPDVVGRFCRL